MQITDLYAVEVNPTRPSNESIPFTTRIKLHGPKGELVRLPATVNGGAMVSAIDSTAFARSRHRLAPTTPSSRILRMADGTLVPSNGLWTGTLEWNNMVITAPFEIFPSGGSWTVLIGKPLLRDIRATHAYDTDTISVPTPQTPINITNTNDPPEDNPREVTEHSSAHTADDPSTVQTITDDTPEIDTTNQDIGVIPDVDLNSSNDVFTRKTTPFNPERIARIQELITVGDDLDSEQRETIRNFIAEYADCFALSVREVLPITFKEHHLRIPHNAKFSTHAPHQRPLTPPQREYFYKTLDELLEAGIIRRIAPEDVKACSPTTLAQKAHSGGGMSITDILHKLNDECIANGRQPAHDLPPRDESDTTSTEPQAKPKWRICQNFAEVNKQTQVPPLVQGDIRLKQQRLAGHRWISVIDFASGFYAVPMSEESQPYTCFYVEGRGFFCYRRMPFGLTGSPSTFGDMTATAIGDLVGIICELFVDDNGMSGNDFNEKLTRLRTFFNRVRDRGLSISPQKTELFMTEAVFGGVRPDLTKLTVVTNWPRPPHLLNLMGFLGLTGWFRHLIQDYARIAKPLTDLVNRLDIQQQARGLGKRHYRQLMRSATLTEHWRDEHTDAFLALKHILTSEPVLRAAKFDGTPFIITTDGSKDGFAGVLSQQHTTTLKSGKTISKLHPIAYASKRTSRTEEKYKPFLLEFAALKFALDQFTDTIWGFPIEIETDCQAVRDTVLSDRISSTHARWRDGIFAHQIVDIRHRPGKSNGAADSISRMYTGIERRRGDGSDWTVSEDWEASTGLVNDLFNISIPEPTIRQLQKRFSNEPVFLDVVNALCDIDKLKPGSKQRRAQHRAMDYMIEDDKLWRVPGPKTTRARSRTECVSKSEAVELARAEHRNNGHWHRDLVKLKLMDRIHSPQLDKSIVTALTECPECKNFGATHLHSLLDPITRRHPFELLVADYLSLPSGKGGWHTVLLLLDTYSQHVWAFKFKTHGTGKTTVTGLERLRQEFRTPETFMTDGGKHFNNNEVRNWCNDNNTDHHVVAAYAPWVNGLVENANKLLLGRLKRACAPELGEDAYIDVTPDSIPKSWPDHLDKVILDLNWRILPAFKFAPRELLMGYVVNTHTTPITTSTTDLNPSDVDVQMAYIDQQRFDGFSHAIEHAAKRKAIFDRGVASRKPGEVIFNKGNLVQVYANEWDHTFRTERKLVPRWSAPRRVAERRQNSYTLETLEGFPISGWYHARRLRQFIPRSGTELARLQSELEIRLREEGEIEQGEDPEKTEADGEDFNGEDGEEVDREEEEPEELDATGTVAFEGGADVAGGSEQGET